MASSSIRVNLRVTGHCSQGGRKYMEDYFSVAYQPTRDETELEYAYFGIFDGHGGNEAAAYAKEHLMNKIVSQPKFWSDNDEDVLVAIRQGYINTHEAMWREHGKWPKTATGLPSTAGTTASVAFIRNGKIFLGHVGDSAIILGYQEEHDKYWRAKPLTIDHKPESPVEKERITRAGGKVVAKSGVPRVVWNRPRIGHKGPVRRSTMIDEIPFLAVARSLGDLWSYNAGTNRFVVSPDPDVRVVNIDAKKFRCLIFASDGVWNVVSASAAIEIVRYADQMNHKNFYEGGVWTNPSKSLVDNALERWCSTRMRADNTSAVVIMVDPPGPPKKDVLTCYTKRNHHQLQRFDPFEDVMPPIHPASEKPFSEDKNFTIFDHNLRKTVELEDMPMPTSGLAVMTRYDNVIAAKEGCSSDHLVEAHTLEQPDVMKRNLLVEYPPNPMMFGTESSSGATEIFTEPYKSLLECPFNSDVVYYPIGHTEADYGYASNSVEPEYSNPALRGDTYSLTRLETRSEQNERDILVSSCGGDGEETMVVSSFNNSDYQQSQPFMPQPQYDSITSSLIHSQNCNVTSDEPLSPPQQHCLNVSASYDEMPVTSIPPIACASRSVSLHYDNNQSLLGGNLSAFETLNSIEKISVNNVIDNNASKTIPSLASSWVKDSIQINEITSSVSHCVENKKVVADIVPMVVIEKRITRSNDANRSLPEALIASNQKRKEVKLCRAYRSTGTIGDENLVISRCLRTRPAAITSIAAIVATTATKPKLMSGSGQRTLRTRNGINIKDQCKKRGKSSSSSAPSVNRPNKPADKTSITKQLLVKNSNSSSSSGSSKLQMLRRGVGSQRGYLRTTVSVVIKKPAVTSLSSGGSSKTTTQSTMVVTRKRRLSKSVTRSNAWNPGKPAVQTRNRVQKRINQQ